MPPRTIRLVPNLSVAAIKTKLDKELAMWYCLRAINHWGSGNLDLECAVKALANKFGYSRSTAYRILNAGEGIFWDKRPLKKTNRVQIRIYGLQRIATHFDIYCGRYFLEIPAGDFTGCKGSRLRHQKAWLYSTFHKPEGATAHPISRASIQQATGVNRRSQQRYDKIASIHIANYADRQDDSGKVIPIIEAVNGKNRQWLVRKQLGSTYYCRARRGHTGILRKMKTASRQSWLRGEACRLKRFFLTTRSYLKCPQRHDDPYLMVLPASKGITGGIEWCRVNP